ncbi:UDP-glycosyltransferase UGT5-like [Phlebotomus papatasi]|uniref:UDP-glycosyltransferase UGT5-like n=1 Tax=Phlebotomus papatasi TaxID=29031 RepID=UPI0024842B40|nr:UDP-glycosyltransferase UGT5-like [Phlebotomus papatasi]
MKGPCKFFSLGFFVFLALGFGTDEVSSYKILMVFPSFSPSHLIVASGLLKGLAKKGHEVTMVSSYPQSKPVKNYRDVVLPLDKFDKDAIMADMVKNAGQQFQMITKMPEMMKMSYDIANETMSNPEFRKIMEEESFDLVILGIFANQFLAGLGYHFKCPVTVMSQVQAVYMTSELVGNPVSLASTSTVFLGYSGRMTFMQRVKNIFAGVLEMLMTQLLLRPYDRMYYESNFPPDKYPSFDESLRNVSLVLVNHHFSQGNLRPYVPAMVEIGGIHIEDETDPLPKDIQEFLDSATDGAVFFSFGSNLKSSILPQHKLNAIIKTFGRLKEKVLFKWENDDLPNKPDNMMIGKWLPQRDILAHKNIKLFVSHGGMGSIAEAKYRGVPLIGVPFFGDQMGNVAVVAEEGWVYQLNFDDLTEETFSEALKEVLTNPKYGDIARTRAQLYKDRPQSALETANYWIEYVIRHKGAPHMQSHAVHLNFWQNNSIDVIAFLFAILLIFIKISILITKFVFRYLKNRLFPKHKKQKQL